MKKNVRDILFNHFTVNFRLYIFVILSFTTGICAGALTVNALDGGQLEAINKYINDFFQISKTQDINNYQLFVLSFIRNLKIVFILWILGMTIIGVPFILILIGIRGFIMGFSVASIINAYGIKGMFFTIMCIFPVNIIVIPCFFVLSVISISFSLLLYKSIVGRNFRKINIHSSFVTYSSIMLVALFLMILSSVLEAFILPALIKVIASF